MYLVDIRLRPGSGKEVKLVITYLISLSLLPSKHESSLAPNKWAKSSFCM